MKTSVNACVRRGVCLSRPMLGLFGVAVLAGCASGPEPLEATFGMASQCTRLLQTADPLAPWTAWHHGAGLQAPRSDGVNARLGVQHYRERQARAEGPSGVVGKEQP